MLDSQARIIEAPRRIGVAGGEAGDDEHAMSFQFRVQWSSVFAAPESAAPIALDAAAPAVLAGPESPVPPAIDLSSPPANQTSTADSGAQWEMVIPKMVRSSSRMLQTPNSPPSAPRPAPKLQPVEAGHSPSPEPQIVRDFVPPLAPPALVPGLGRRRAPLTASFAASLATKLFLGGVLAAGVAIPVLLRVYGTDPQAVISPSPHNSSPRRLAARILRTRRREAASATGAVPAFARRHRLPF